MQLLGLSDPAQPAKGGASDVIKDSSTASFATDVIQESQKTPVLVDFWAPWCGPCKQLGPILEKVVKQANGKVRLVKVNIDDNPELAQQLRVQSVPTVYAFVGGQPVTGFTGAQPESQVKALVERLAGGPLGPADTEVELSAAKEALDAGDITSAFQIYNAILQEEPGQPNATGGVARCLISSNRIDEAQKLLDEVGDEQANHVAITGAKAALQLASEAGTLGDPNALKARIDANQADYDARFELANVWFLRGQVEPAMEQLCAIVKQDREWRDDGARQQMVRFFDALGPTHPQTVKGRRMLSSVLFS